jgi:hypothetical protein
MILEIGT